MRAADTVNDEFEVGYNQNFETKWYRAELIGRVVMIGFVAAAGLGFLGRGPFSHRTVRSPDGHMAVDYEPIARHGTATTITVHLHNPDDTARPVQLTLDQHVIEPMGYQHATPLPDNTSVSDAGIRLGFLEQPRQKDMLVRFGLAPTAVGYIPVTVSDGQSTVSWHMLVVP